jgi:hypothetical protein
MQTSIPSTIRVPTPEEISAWASSLARRLRDYAREPEHQVMWGIILLGAVLRLAHLDLIPLRAEQVEHLRAALNLMGRGQPWGPQSPAPPSDTLPMLHYLLGIPLLLGRDPRLASAFVALVNVAAIGGFYSLVRRYYGIRASVLATMLFSAAPWAVVFARRISGEGLVIPFSVLFLQGWAMALLDGEPVGWALIAITLGVTLYTSLLALPLIFAVIVLIVIYHRRVEWPYLLFGGCLASIMFVPYLYEQNLSRFEQLLPLLRRLLMRTGVLPARQGLDMATWLHSGQQLSRLVAPSGEAFRVMGPLSRWIAWLGSVLFLLGLPGMIALAIHAWGHWKEGEDHAKYVIPVVLLGAPLLATGLQPGPLEPRSLTILYPSGFLAMGLLIDKVIGLCTRERMGDAWRSLGLRVVIYLLFLSFIFWNVHGVISLYDLLPDHNAEIAYGVPYRFWEQTVDLLRRETAEAGGDQAWVITSGADSREVPIQEALAYLTAPTLKTLFLSQEEGPSMLLPAARPGIYLFTHSAPFVEGTVRRLGAEECGVVRFPNGRSLRLQVAEEKAIEEIVGGARERGDWPFGSGLQLIGYDWSVQNVTLSTYWTFPAPAPGRRRGEHQLHICLQTADGRSIACCSGFGLEERYWEQGLVLKQWCRFSMSANPPPGEYELLMEMRQSHGPPGAMDPGYVQPYRAHLGTVSVVE